MTVTLINVKDITMPSPTFWEILREYPRIISGQLFHSCYRSSAGLRSIGKAESLLFTCWRFRTNLSKDWDLEGMRLMRVWRTSSACKVNSSRKMGNSSLMIRYFLKENSLTKKFSITYPLLSSDLARHSNPAGQLSFSYRLEVLFTSFTISLFSLNSLRKEMNVKKKFNTSVFFIKNQGRSKLFFKMNSHYLSMNDHFFRELRILKKD